MDQDNYSKYFFNFFIIIYLHFHSEYIFYKQFVFGPQRDQNMVVLTRMFLNKIEKSSLLIFTQWRRCKKIFPPNKFILTTENAIFTRFAPQK